jgi:outer membrane protein
MKNFFIIFFFLIISCFNFSLAETKNDKIVFINLDYIFVNSLAGKDLNLQITNKEKDLKIKVNNFRKEIDLKKTKLITQKNVLSQDDYQKKVSELEVEIGIINKSISAERKNLSLFKSKAEKQFTANLNSIIEKYAIENSISIVLKKKDILMAKNDLDITEIIFNKMNEKIEKITIK